MEENKRYTTILIKRRVSGDPGPPPSLQHGELAFNEVGSTLYIGNTTSESLSSEPVGTKDFGTF